MSKKKDNNQGAPQLDSASNGEKTSGESSGGERYFVAKGRKVFCRRGKLLEGTEVAPKDFGCGQRTIDDFVAIGALDQK